MWAAGIAALSGLIALHVHTGEAVPCAQIPVGKEPEKFCRLPTIEGVIVSDIPDDIDRASAVADHVHLLRSQGRRMFRPMAKVSPWAEIPNGPDPRPDKLGDGSSCKRKSPKSHAHDRTEFVSWRLPSVHDPKVDFGDQTDIHVRYARLYGKDIGSQFTLGSSLQVLELAVASPSPVQADGRKPQPDGRDRQNYSEERDNNLVVVVALDGINSGGGKSKRTSKEGGAVFLIVLVGCLLVVLYFYQAGMRP